MTFRPETVAVAQFVGPPPLLQLLHHADRYPEAPGNLFPRALPRIVARHDPLPQVQRQRLHPPSQRPIKRIWLKFYLKCSSLSLAPDPPLALGLLACP